MTVEGYGKASFALACLIAVTLIVFIYFVEVVIFKRLNELGEKRMKCPECNSECGLVVLSSGGDDLYICDSCSWVEDPTKES